MYDLYIKPEVDKIFSKLAKKDRKQLQIINKKINNILKNPDHEYKFLMEPLQTFNRIHLNKHFVLIFKIDHKKKRVEIYFYGNHDEVYQWRPDVLTN